MKKILSALLVAAMCISLVPCAFAVDIDKFADVSETDWYADSIAYSVDNGLFSGTSKTTFSPEQPMTRAMFVTVLSRMSGVDTNIVEDNHHFADVSFDKYYGPNVIWAYENGIVNGTSATTFSPDSNITREQIAVLVYRYLNEMNVSVPNDTNAPASFLDASDISSYAKDAVDAMREWGFVTGSNDRYRPVDNVNRAEAATILMRVHYFLTTGEKYAQNTGSGNTHDTPSPIVPIGITVSNKTVDLKVGDTYQIVPFVAPTNANDKSVVFTSDDTKIATVDKQGNVVAKHIGTTNITVKSANQNSNAKTVVTIQVKPDYIGVSQVTFDKLDATLHVGETMSLAVIISPNDATDKNITWASSDNQIATVQNGIVTAKKVGASDITATVDGKTATCKIKVVEKTPPVETNPNAGFIVTTPEFDIASSIYDEEDCRYISCGAIRITDNDEKWLLDDAQYLDFYFSELVKYTFKSSDENIIKVTENGELYDPIRLENNANPVTAYITVTKVGGGSATVQVTVRPTDCWYVVDDAYIEEFAAEFFRLINELRAEVGVQPLSYVYEAQDCINERSRELSIKMSHVRPNKEDNADLRKEYGITQSLGMENIASVSINGNKGAVALCDAKRMANSIFTLWKNSSSGHYRTMVMHICSEMVIGLCTTDTDAYSALWIG